MDTLAVVLIGAGLLVLGLLVYFVPTLVARRLQRRQTAAIFILNLFLGWTFLFWVLALVWAVADDRAIPVPAPDPHQPPSQAPSPPSRMLDPAPAVTLAAPEPGQRFELTAAAIVRVDPLAYARSIGELRPGTEVTVVRAEGEWLWVRSDAGQEGWIKL
jgi:hypothetical protein